MINKMVKTINICSHVLHWAGNFIELCEDHARDRLIRIENNGDLGRLSVYNGNIKRCCDCESEAKE